MIKKTVQYTDFNGDLVNEILHFNFTEAELLTLEAEKKSEGGMKAWGETLSVTQDVNEAIRAYTLLLSRAYGEKSSDGKRFLKTDEIRSAFLASEAFSTVLFEFLQNMDEGGKFFSALVPRGGGKVTDGGLSISEQARRNSEAAMQGHKSPQQPSFQTEPTTAETVIQQTAPPVLEQSPAPDVFSGSAATETTDQRRARLLAELEGLN